MKKSQLIKKFDEKVQELFDVSYEIKELLDVMEDGELESLADGFVEQIEECIAEGDINIESIKDYIASMDNQ